MVPPAPTGLTVTSSASNVVGLAWQDASTNEEEFRLERRTESGDFVLIATLPANSTSYDDTSVAASTAYTYRASAANEDGTSAYSNEAGTVTPAVVAPTDSFAKTYSITGTSDAVAVVQTDDGGYAIAARAKVTGGVYNDLWVLRLDESGAPIWSRTFDDTANDEYPSQIIETASGEFLIASSDDDGNGAGRVTLLSSDGALQWQRRFSSGSGSAAQALVQTDDDADGVANDGYILAGTAGGGAAVIKLQADGQVSWSLEGISGRKTATSVRQTSDGGYVVAGSYRTNDIFSEPDRHIYWLSKLDETGAVEWEHAIGPGGKTTAEVAAVLVAADGYILVGHAGFLDDPSFKFNPFIVKVSTAGELVWQKQLESETDTYVYGAALDADDGVVLTGTHSNDMWVVKVAADGELVKQVRFGAISADAGASIQPTLDAGLIVAGQSSSFDGANKNVWLVKLPQSWDIDFLPAANGHAIDTDAVVNDTEFDLEDPVNTLEAGTLSLQERDPDSAAPEVEVHTQSY